jgi:hypothetical protein
VRLLFARLSQQATGKTHDNRSIENRSQKPAAAPGQMFNWYFDRKQTALGSIH